MNAYLTISFAPGVTRDEADRAIKDLEGYWKACGGAGFEVTSEEAWPRLSRFAKLSPREQEILKLLAEGNSVKTIASDLNLSVNTVEAHKYNLMRKLDIHNKAQLVQYAIQRKIIKIPNLT